MLSDTKGSLNKLTGEINDLPVPRKQRQLGCLLPGSNPENQAAQHRGANARRNQAVTIYRCITCGRFGTRCAHGWSD